MNTDIRISVASSRPYLMLTIPNLNMYILFRNLWQIINVKGREIGYKVLQISEAECYMKLFSIYNIVILIYTRYHSVFHLFENLAERKINEIICPNSHLFKYDLFY